jgi:hypothetical protein
MDVGVAVGGIGVGVAVGEMGVGVAVGGIGVGVSVGGTSVGVDVGSGVAAGAPHPTTNDMTNVSPTIDCNNFP